MGPVEGDAGTGRIEERGRELLEILTLHVLLSSQSGDPTLGHTGTCTVNRRVLESEE